MILKEIHKFQIFYIDLENWRRPKTLTHEATYKEFVNTRLAANLLCPLKSKATLR